MPRYSWTGFLRLSLVSCPVHLAPAVSGSERVSFHLLNPKTHNRIQTRTVDPQTGEEIARGELERGYEYEKGQYVVVSKDELAEVQIESSKVIDLARFVDRAAIDPVFYNESYYLAPEGKMAQETFRVIREALEDTGKAAIGRVVLSTREHPVMLVPEGKGMLLVTLHSADEVRKPDEFFDDIPQGKLDQDMVEMAKTLIKQKSGEFDPQALTGDRYQEALRELIEAKLKGRKPAALKLETPSNVVNLMDALRQSLAGDGKKAASPAAAPKKRAKQQDRRQGSMLLPVGGGKKGKQPRAAEKETASTRRKAS